MVKIKQASPGSANVFVSCRKKYNVTCLTYFDFSCFCSMTVAQGHVGMTMLKWLPVLLPMTTQHWGEKKHSQRHKTNLGQLNILSLEKTCCENRIFISISILLIRGCQFMKFKADGKLGLPTESSLLMWRWDKTRSERSKILKTNYNQQPKLTQAFSKRML